MNFLMCEPHKAYFEVEDLKIHNITERAKIETAIFQHRKLSSTIESFGHKVIKAEELKDHPNSVFTKDPVFCTPFGYIKMRMGLESRRSEEEWLGNMLESMGKNRIGEITFPATAEGGDVILSDHVAFLGFSTRTNSEGINQLSKILSSLGYEIRVAKVPQPYLHLGGMMTFLGGKNLIGVKSLFERDFFNDFKILEVPSDNFISGNVIFLPPDKIIAEKSNLTAIKILKKFGFEVHEIDLSEFVKGTGGPTCLVQQF
ncbi:MAG: arginine deiminase family protein [Thermotogae bacterium]|nr:arginine deiminase family protein [Thermotogota bacterium]MCL5031755.1 arginine deiminase family protein [Thermotogota bacterium]